VGRKNKAKGKAQNANGKAAGAHHVADRAGMGGSRLFWVLTFAFCDLRFAF
jgi:hypothetical protein